MIKSMLRSEISDNRSYKSMLAGTPAVLVTSGLVLRLDAGDVASYSGTGTTWTDLSGAGNNFTLTNASAFKSSGPKYMDFNGSFGLAYREPDITLGNTVTYMVWTRIRDSSAEWRTLTRATAGTTNHHVIVSLGGWHIGMYNNSGLNTPQGFNASGYLQTSLPNYGTSDWICMYWRFDTSSPYYRMSYNDTPEISRATITTTGSQYNNTGFGTLGGLDRLAPQQPWGDIAAFYAYNRVLTDAELTQNFNATRARFGL